MIIFFLIDEAPSGCIMTGINLALQTGGKLAERIAKLMSIQISDTSLLRIVNNAHCPLPETPYALGIDDWAYKKRNRYGSILVNLENKRVIDILNNREACSIERWLKAHPGGKNNHPGQIWELH